MKLPDLMLTGWAEIRAHKMRSFLSFFAIAIGIATFFYTLSILSQRYEDIDQTVKISGQGRISTSTSHALTMTQYQDFLHLLPANTSLSLVTDWGNWGTSPWYKGQEITKMGLVGVLPSWRDVDFVYRLEGRFFNWQDIENKSRVAVIMVRPREKEADSSWSTYGPDPENPTIALEELTYRHNLLNQLIQIGQETFTVVGILHIPPVKDDPRFLSNRDYISLIQIPYTTWYDIQPSYRDYFETNIRIVTGQENTANTAATQTVSFLRSQFGPEEKPDIQFFRDTVKDYIQIAYAELKKMLFLGFIAMIAGGIGIMNVTMAVIYSRTKEIGIRRALGATQWDILFQFLIEAMLLGFCGSAAGMLLGYGALLRTAEDVSQMTFSWWVVVLSVLIGLFTSFLFALYPAWQAAKLKPIDALKYE